MLHHLHCKNLTFNFCLHLHCQNSTFGYICTVEIQLSATFPLSKFNFRQHLHCQKSTFGYISTVKIQLSATFTPSKFHHISTNLRMFLYIFTGHESLEKCNLCSRAKCKKSMGHNAILAYTCPPFVLL
jgi:hypothetical protein